jgi:L-2-hydroxyglutarate oxidase
MYDCAIVGGGVVGLATAFMLGRSQPGVKLLLLEKEPELAFHQTGHNSGVIHSGIYYKPGSLKALLAREGNRSLVAFCKQHGIAHEICGKVIVATREKELATLELLYRRGLENGIPVSRLSPEAAREIEPHVRALAALKVESTGIVQYREVCLKFAELIREKGGVLETGARVQAIRWRDETHVLETTRGVFKARFLINCGGLHSDRIARMAESDPEAKIVPFRGDYYQLVPEKRHMVRTLVYPVPDLAFPFLGVHFTKMIDGSVHAGPNAVLALKREGYRKTDVSARDLLETLAFPGFWKMARQNLSAGCKEMYRSVSKGAFVRSLQQLVPEVTAHDLVAAEAGVRAQALLPDGRLFDDFLFVDGRHSLHVCNAPSPAATASLEIGKAVASRVPDLYRLR